MRKSINIVTLLILLLHYFIFFSFGDGMRFHNSIKNPFSELSLRKKGMDMSYGELHKLQNQLLESINMDINKTLNERSLLYNSPITLIAGLYKNNKEEVEDFLDLVKANLMESFMKRGDMEFNAEDKNDLIFHKKFVLYQNSLDQIIALSHDENDIDFCLETIEKNMDTPFCAARLILCKRLIMYYNEDNVDSLVKVKIERLIYKFIEIEKAALELSKDRSDFIRSYRNSTAILKVLIDRKDENRNETGLIP